MQFLCAPSYLPEGQSRGFTLDEERVFAVRKDGQVFVYRNYCPHRSVPLDWQPDQFLDSSASLIQCATHGALFLIDSGECVAGPCAGQSLYKLESREGADGIWVNL
ncbi:Rieske 2Fe-2S domain-containing protein [Pseudomonas sp. MS19]|uniref:Rieske (2Fe-2S) protein n=1 Tax=Pseudomonas sp. MS19 TaxID=2579939 RepID=UPI001562DB50|nr:Rieske 2Fe-2S domain-containing protein [Pseudomonas sp. MS19]NRH27393.1 Rieske 2Fe-2S domain-containing protein [Pseudomonas sp. MS19]